MIYSIVITRSIFADIFSTHTPQLAREGDTLSIFKLPIMIYVLPHYIKTTALITRELLQSISLNCDIHDIDNFNAQAMKPKIFADLLL